MTDAPGELLVPAAIAREMLDLAQLELPNEACGLLSGDTVTGAVQAFHPARNEHASPLRYSIDPRDLVRITYRIEAADESLVAIFHSHPGSAAEPSPTDVREALYPEALHILSGVQGDLRAWRISAGAATEVALHVVEGALR